MNFAIIENGIVTNVIIASEEFISQSDMQGVFSSVAAIGDRYENGEFIKPVAQEVLEFNPVYPVELRLALFQLGFIEEVENNVQGEGKIAFEYGLIFNRDSDITNKIFENTTITQQQIDEIFLLAQSLHES